MMVYGFMKEHMDDHVQAVAASLKAKRDAMLGALAENFPPSCWWSKPEGGMMIWVRLPEEADTWAALDKAVEAGVKYNPGGVFRAGRDCNNYRSAHLQLQYPWRDMGGRRHPGRRVPARGLVRLNGIAQAVFGNHLEIYCKAHMRPPL